MSNNKSRRLARRAGGHMVFSPGQSFYISDAVRYQRTNFVKLATGHNNINDIVVRFYEILCTFRENPIVVDIVSQRTGLSKKNIIKILLLYAKEYKSEAELNRLLTDGW